MLLNVWFSPFVFKATKEVYMDKYRHLKIVYDSIGLPLFDDGMQSLFAYELDGVWGELFTHVHWEQRGAGKTLRRNKKTVQPESGGQVGDNLPDAPKLLLNLLPKMRKIQTGLRQWPVSRKILIFQKCLV